MKTVAIVNPTAGRHLAQLEWPRLLRSMGSKGSRVATWWTERPGHAELLAARARREGFERVVAVGGDGTLFEVANGLWWEPRGKLPDIGMVPFGTGCDYPRNFDLGRTQTEQLATALGKSVVRIDAGLCRLRGIDGKPARRLFLMELGIGFDAQVVRRFREGRILKRGWTAYALSAVQEFFHHGTYRLKGKIDGEAFEAECCLFVVALGRFFGKGMKIAPAASIGFGRFEIIWVEPIGRLQMLPLFFSVYFGLHTRHPRVHSFPARQLELQSDLPTDVQAEGEPIGKTPIQLDISPGAFSFAAREGR